MKTDHTLIKTENLFLGYKKSGILNTVLSDLNLNLQQGELACLIGRNGSGKTTLLRSLARIQKAEQGNIFLHGENIHSYSSAEFARKLAFASTEMTSAFEMRIEELVALGRYPYTSWTGKLTKNDKEMISRSIHAVGIDILSSKKISEVSDGERQRALFARILAQDTELILLDEPTAFLDIPNKYEIGRIMRDLCDDQKTILFSTHDFNLAMTYADKIWLINDGKILDGSPEDIILNGDFGKLFNSDIIRFDTQLGEFFPVYKSEKCVRFSSSLPADDLASEWTRKALKRNGYEMTSREEKNIPAIFLMKEKDKNIWKLQMDNKNLLFSNLYDLIKNLNT